MGWLTANQSVLWLAWLKENWTFISAYLLKINFRYPFLFKSATKYIYVTCFSLTIQFSYHFIFCSICYLLKSMYISLHRIMSISSTKFKYRISKLQRQRFNHRSWCDIDMVCLFTCILHIYMLRSLFNFQMYVHVKSQNTFVIWTSSHWLCSRIRGHIYYDASSPWISLTDQLIVQLLQRMKKSLLTVCVIIIINIFHCMPKLPTKKVRIILALISRKTTLRTNVPVIDC